MRRSYRQRKFLGILDKVREAMPHAAITTDIIVGFPGETEEDFQATLDVVEQARFSSVHLPVFAATGNPGSHDGRPGAAGGRLERYKRLIALQEKIASTRTSAWSVPRPNCLSSPTRVVNPLPHNGRQVVPVTADWCISQPVTGRRRSGRVMW